ncbi:MAG TPA: sensor histidine kinase, partial [Mycobacterium sp.]
MVRHLRRIVDYFAAEPVRVSAVLRLPLIALMGFLVWLWEVDSWLPGVYTTILGAYAVVAVLWVVAVFRGPVPSWGGWISTGVDMLAVVSLCVVSGGATAALLPVFFLLPLSVAFGDRPVLTGVLGLSTAACYLAAWIVYSKRDDHVGLPDVVYLQVGFLLWLAVATTALCLVLTRRAARVTVLLDVRRRLVAESMQADERTNRDLAEHLHDGPLQTLLAARMELDEVRERIPDPALDMVYEALNQTAAGLRSTVTALHPQVLAQLGLAPGIRELLR